MPRNITILRYDTRYRIDSGSSIRIAIRLDFAHPEKDFATWIAQCTKWVLGVLKEVAWECILLGMVGMRGLNVLIEQAAAVLAMSVSIRMTTAVELPAL